eukprot:Pgem_evm1s9918
MATNFKSARKTWARKRSIVLIFTITLCALYIYLIPYIVDFLSSTVNDAQSASSIIINTSRSLSSISSFNFNAVNKGNFPIYFNRIHKQQMRLKSQQSQQPQQPQQPQKKPQQPQQPQPQKQPQPQPQPQPHQPQPQTQPQVQLIEMYRKQQQLMEKQLLTLQNQQLQLLNNTLLDNEIKKQRQLVKLQIEDHKVQQRKQIFLERKLQKQQKKLKLKKEEFKSSPCTGNPSRENDLAIVYLTKNTKSVSFV